MGYELPDSKLKGSKGDKNNTDKNKVFSVQEDGEEESEELEEEINESAEEECVFLLKNNDKIKFSIKKNLSS